MLNPLAINCQCRFKINNDIEPVWKNHGEYPWHDRISCEILTVYFGMKQRFQHDKCVVSY